MQGRKTEAEPERVTDTNRNMSSHSQARKCPKKERESVMPSARKHAWEHMNMCSALKNMGSGYED